MHLSKVNTYCKLVSVNKGFTRYITGAAAIKKENTKALKTFNDIPGPPRLPILGQAYNFLPVVGKFYGVQSDEMHDIMFKNYGPIVRIDGILGMPPMAILFDPEACAQVLRGENWMPVRPGFPTLEYFRKKHNKTEENTDTDRYTGLLSDHGELWKDFRMKVNPIMLQPKTVQLYRPVLDEVAQDMIKRIKEIRDENGMIKDNFDIEANKWALESIGTVALGGRIGCLDSSTPEDSPAGQLIKGVHEVFHYSSELDFKPSLWRYYPTKTFKEAMVSYEKVIRLTKYFIDHAKKNLEANSEQKSENEKAILEKLLKIDENVANIMASDMLLAGVDTAANTVAATLYLLAVNPDKQEKLRDEVRSVSDYKKRPYLKACLKEAMRMMPVAGGNIRLATKDYNILGYELLKGTYISFVHKYMSNQDEHYPRAKEYLPERWLVDKEDPLYHGHAHPFAHHPFGFGVRMCIGKRIAELEMEVFLARTVEAFRVGWEGAPPKIRTSTLNYIDGPFNYIFKDL